MADAFKVWRPPVVGTEGATVGVTAGRGILGRMSGFVVDRDGTDCLAAAMRVTSLAAICPR